MSEFEIIDNKKNQFKFCFDNYPGEMSLNFNGKDIFRSTGVELGILKERNGFEERCRLHQNEKNHWYRVETITRHPFGPEPKLKHKYEQAGNHIRVTTDIQISRQLPMENVIVDNLFFTGQWKKVTVVQYDDSSEELYTEEYSASGINLEFKKIPIAVLFESEDGVRIEVGTGFDLWRWSNLAEQYDAFPRFTLTDIGEGINFCRCVAEWNEEFIMERKDLRFNWYLSWDFLSDESIHIPENIRKLYFRKKGLEEEDGNSFGFMLVSEYGKDVEKSSDSTLCFASRQFNNSFKHWIRRIYNQDESSDIFILGMKPGICGKNAHIGNKKKNEVTHFDYPFILGIWEWANKYMAEKNIKLKIDIDKSSVLKNFPSSKGLVSYS